MARDSSRERILDALEQVLNERGVGAVTLDAVCEVAGVSKGGLLYHFASKADLYAGLTARVADTIRAEIAAAPTEPDELVRWFIRGAVTENETESSLWRSLLAGIRADDHTDAADDTSSALALLLEEWARPLARFEPVLAAHIRLVADGLYFNGLVGAPPPPDDVLDAIIEPLAAAARG